MSDALKNSSGTPSPKVDDVGYKRPPAHSRFKPGQSGNPSGRPKGTQNLRTLFHKILKEEVSLREGAEVRKVSKAEAILRGLVVGAMKGDPRSVVALFKLAEQTGQFGEEDRSEITQIRRVIVGWDSERGNDPTVVIDTGFQKSHEIPANSENNKEDP